MEQQPPHIPGVGAWLRHVSPSPRGRGFNPRKRFFVSFNPAPRTIRSINPYPLPPPWKPPWKKATEKHTLTLRPCRPESTRGGERRKHGGAPKPALFWGRDRTLALCFFFAKNMFGANFDLNKSSCPTESAEQTGSWSSPGPLASDKIFPYSQSVQIFPFNPKNSLRPPKDGLMIIFMIYMYALLIEYFLVRLKRIFFPSKSRLKKVFFVPKIPSPFFPSSYGYYLYPL